MAAWRAVEWLVCSALLSSESVNVASVSYTHLDVYKRQAGGTPKPNNIEVHEAP